MLARDSLEVVFLMETKLGVSGMINVKNILQYQRGHFVDAEGRSGGLGILWSDSMDVTISSSSSHHIDCTVGGLFSNERWRLTGLYGWADNTQKYRSWELLKSLKDMSVLPWLAIGDLNQILLEAEKKGGSPRAQRDMDEFREALDDCGLQDMGYNGNIFTWGNNQSTPSAMYERLDRAVTSLEWITLIPHAAVIHIPRDRSDHVPLKLIDSPLGGGGKKKFRIEDMWITTPGCERVVKDVWSRGEGLQNAADLIVKIKKCGTALQKWNREEFGHIQTKIKEARKRLAYLDSCAPSDSIVVERKKVSSSIDNLLYLEETMWRKQSRVINLCEGDQNTKFFHMKTSCRKKRNFVKGVHNDNWEWVTDQESVKGVAQRYFQHNFSSSNPEYVEEIIVGIQGRVIG